MRHRLLEASVCGGEHVVNTCGENNSPQILNPLFSKDFIDKNSFGGERVRQPNFQETLR